MSIKEYFERIDLLEIHDLVLNQISEDIFLEFKTANFPIVTEFDKKNFSKVLSGFSNSSGGILIWGILAKQKKNKPDVAGELKPIPNLIDFETYLKKNEGNAVVPLIDGVEYRRIFEDKQSGYLLVFIPQSDRAPHMALFSDKRYYKRSGDSFYMCEHFDIIDMLNRKTNPKIEVEIKNENIRKSIKNNEDRYTYQGVFCVNNIGQVSLKHLVVFIKVQHPFYIADYGIDGNGNRGMKKIATKDLFTKYIGGSDLVVHPETYHEVDKIVLNEIGLDKSIDDLIIEYKVIAEGMKLFTGTIVKKKDDLINNTST